ncbi:MAG: pyruvate dehydrogenase (acetyl-transferring) E1 component subunit alpha [Candidatus Eisenbacteria bacterium]|uniref:Pyruvate dehydrogenase E1 component subunit alpha n=1 Tax=Eiseniibacteriota bacterium TaxID=2212470 RepID=A0A948RXD7_UNCEI|nr:pyruvate dehydrogenase (acetyl-transferring) E1 component subunit alpha [Candidatus Eisenbacteria bacterium]MBU1948348.1 pyruvate dehydrogenase (acetyl-transferring) E1 component subunit alpha [Candidatus Eisenbacteria bacterium]MBU2692241.1 pyruvate dehydrogenase (acetyl-transferring) E1 component subunit alpha [Candidatus Eisenbacteria bacterium]
MPIKEVGHYSVSYLQILDASGNVDKELEPKISDEDLLALYRGMVMGRAVDQRMLNLQRQGRIGTFAPSTGQEAAHIVPAFLMNDKDWFVGAFRETGARLLRGETITQTLLYYNGFEEGNKRSGNRRILPVSIIVAGQALHAVGIGYAMKYQGEKDTSVICIMGDGATSEGDFHEALNFAGVWNVPVVFIVQNNQWAISLPREKQTSSKTLAQKSIAFDIPGIQVDGNDPLGMYVATKEALERARTGGGPTLIEAVTYRLMMHTTADDPKKYRQDDEVEGWQAKDPLIRFKKYLEDKGLWDEQKEEALQGATKEEIDAGVKAFEEFTELPPEACFDHVFAKMTPELEEQKQDFLKRKGS